MTTPATATAYARSSSVICGMSCCGCGALEGPPAFVRRHGTAGLWFGCAGNPPTQEQAYRNTLACASLWLNREDSSPRPFFLASYRCQSSAGPAAGPQGYLTQGNSKLLRSRPKPKYIAAKFATRGKGIQNKNLTASSESTIRSG